MKATVTKHYTCTVQTFDDINNVLGNTREKLEIETRKIEQLDEANSTCSYPTFCNHFCLLYKLPEKDKHAQNTLKTDITINVKCVKNVFVGSAIWTLLSEKRQCIIQFYILDAMH